MPIGTCKEITLALTLALGFSATALRAQSFLAPVKVYTTGSNPVNFEFRADGTLIAKGNLGVGLLLSTDQGPGTRMLWYPAKGALRAGTITAMGTAWDTANIGQGSVAFGQDPKASGPFSFAAGTEASASGSRAIAMGEYAVASGGAAVALGGGASASGYGSIALGNGSSAVGAESFAFGDHAWANGYQSTAIGYGAWANGYGSIAFHTNTTANGDFASAFGPTSTASAYASFVVGRFNVGGGSATAWVPTDPLFEVGNGNYPTLSDALVVYKNGSAKFSGVVQVQPGGDIPMYTGN